MAGRAGRTGLTNSGESIILCRSDNIERVKKMLMEPSTSVLSALAKPDSVALQNLVLSGIALYKTQTTEDIQELVQKRYYQYSPPD